MEEKNIKPLYLINTTSPPAWKNFDHAFLLKTVRRCNYTPYEKKGFDYYHIIKSNDFYSLPFSLLSSYACYFFEPEEDPQLNPYHWKGIVSPFNDLELLQVSSNEIMVGSSSVYSTTVLDYLKDVLDMGNREYLSPEDENIQKIVELYPGLRIPKLKENLLDLLISIFCSQHTKIENARNWFLFLKKYYRRMKQIIDTDPYEIMKESKLICGKSMGYRARYVKDILSVLSANGSSPEEKLRHIIKNNSLENARRELISFKYLGPKTADCFLLNSTGNANIPPIDVNVKRVFERIYSTKSFDLPQSNFCEKYLCESVEEDVCPIYVLTEEIISGSKENERGCLRAALKIKYKNSGWIQALMFLFGLEFCKSRKAECQYCVLEKSCSGPQKIIMKQKGKRMRFSRIRRKKKKYVYLKLLNEYPEKEELIEKFAQNIYNKSISSGMQGAGQYLLAASYWIAVRNNKIALTMKEVADSYGLDKNYLFKIISRMKTRLSINLERLYPKDYVFSIAKKLGFTDDLIERAEIRISNRKFLGRSPIGIAAASVYLEAKESKLKITQKEISEISGVSGVTIRSNSKLLNTQTQQDI